MSNGTMALTIAFSAIATYGIRLAGLMLGDRAVPPAVARFLHFVPVAAFAAIIGPSLSGRDPDLAPRLIAATAASLAVIRFGRLSLCVLIGMSVYWLSSAVI